MFQPHSSVVPVAQKIHFWMAGLLLFAWVDRASGQSVYTSDTSSVSFFSSTPLEDIKAHNEASTAIIEMSTRTLRFQVPIAAFQFDNTLMQEHFNEGYLEPSKFPYATFRGKLSDSLDLSIDTVYKIEATGMLNVHGIDRVGTYNGVISCEDSIATLVTDFKILLADHAVKIPGVVFDNVAKEVEVKMFFRFIPYRKQD
ncbi:MAG: YceI family protein [Flavobacteriales bacterium]|nr:YceI family protein [Flavobacteriales bacterium]